LNSVQSKGSNYPLHHHHQHHQQQQQQQQNGPATALAHQQRLEKAFLPQFLPSVLRDYGRKSPEIGGKRRGERKRGGKEGGLRCTYLGAACSA